MEMNSMIKWEKILSLGYYLFEDILDFFKYPFDRLVELIWVEWDCECEKSNGFKSDFCVS